ncbi:MAG: hypothetical protein KatS3mg045_0092 [Bellilinea sp.]|nr:MAG: hypothetical protein KatS3mg045_0092 [Bellilinea sp.]
MNETVPISSKSAVVDCAARLQLNGEALGEFEILAISAGEGNGWTFTAEVLRQSLPLWDGRECYLDHHLGERSLRDLAGVVYNPQWDEARQGIRLRLKPLGPAASLLRALGSTMLTEAIRPQVGFSADLLFTARGREVERIVRVLSVDCVIQPARGGAFLRALNRKSPSSLVNHFSTFGENPMNELNPTPISTAAEEKAASPQPTTAALEGELCRLLLEQSLAAAHLPTAAAERIRRQFSGQTFDPADLQRTIEDTRQMVSELTAGQWVNGPARIEAVYSPEDQLKAAVHDLLGIPKPAALHGLKAARLSGIRELYTLLTGDYDFYGGYYPERVTLATTTTLPGLLKDALNKMVVMGWEELGRSGYRWWEPIVSVEHFSNLHPITGVLVGEVSVLPGVAEGAAYTELAIRDSAEVGEWGKYGGFVALTLEMFERDETHKLRQYPRKLASAALRRISALVGSIFTANNGVGPQMADGSAVFHAANHRNLGTEALSGEAWEAASKAIYEQPMLVAEGATAPKLALDARYLIVPRSLRLTAMRILYPAFEREASIFSENLQRGEMGDVITCPEFSDANDWAAVADPKLAPGIILGERFGLLPEIFIADRETSGALFTHDEIRMKVRHWVSVFVADYRPLYKANVA